jgi:hypothetical protein
LNIPHLTPRWILQHWGTDILRDKFHQDIWLASLERKLLNYPENSRIVITDCRFPNEIDILKRLGAKIIKVERDDCKKSSSNHSSENSCKEIDFDFVIETNSSLTNLREKIINLTL